MRFKLPKKKLEKLGINVIYLFGSQAQNNTSPLSDFDFGIVLEKPEKYKDNTLEIYSELYDIFTEILPKEYLRRRFRTREHELDIIFLQFAPISLQFEVIKNSKILYERDREKRLNYEEYVMKRHADLEYFYNLRHEAILERI